MAIYLKGHFTEGGVNLEANYMNTKIVARFET